MNCKEVCPCPALLKGKHLVRTSGGSVLKKNLFSINCHLLFSAAGWVSHAVILSWLRSKITSTEFINSQETINARLLFALVSGRPIILAVCIFAGLRYFWKEFRHFHETRYLVCVTGVHRDATSSSKANHTKQLIQSVIEVTYVSAALTWNVQQTVLKIYME
jgi:hypothetical protein